MKKTLSLLLLSAIALPAFVCADFQVASDESSIEKSKAFNERAIIFSCNANLPLAQKVAEYLNVQLGSATISHFNDGEIQIQVKDNVRNKDVFIVQSTCTCQKQSVNDNLMELYLLIRTMVRASASSITIVIPYYGYARQDRKAAPRVPISAADVAQLLELAGVDRVLTVDLHCGQIQGFFHNVPVDNLYAASVFIPYFVGKQDLRNVVIVSPDAGGVDRANKFMNQLEKKGVSCNMALISKQRGGAGVIASMNLIGSVADADAIIVDDLCDTGSTLMKAAQLLKDNGARRVFAVVTHPVFSGDALQKLGKSTIDEMVIADTIPLRGEVPANVRVISVSPLLGEAIRRIELGESISALFQ